MLCQELLVIYKIKWRPWHFFYKKWMRSFRYACGSGTGKLLHSLLCTVVNFWKVSETRNSPINIECMHHKGSLQKSIFLLNSSNFARNFCFYRQKCVDDNISHARRTNYCSTCENDSVQRVKTGMKGIGIGLWTHHILLRTTFRCPLVYTLFYLRRKFSV